MRNWYLAGAATMLLGGVAHAQSLNTYGNVGLIDLPSADVAPDGNIAFAYSQVGNSGRATVNFQLAPKVEGSIRYSAIDGFGTGGQRSDRQFDLKIQLLVEGTYAPSVAVGFRDFIGSAVYSSEYLVATKEVRPGLRLTGGLGWGRLAGERAFDNPGGGARENLAGGPEELNGMNFFDGPDVGLFGGVEWQPDNSDWRLKVEYSPDTYAQEVASGNFSRSNGWNVGVERNLGAGVDGGLYWMGGDEVGFRLSFSADPRISRLPPDLLNGPAPFTARPAGGKRGTNWTKDFELQGKLIEALVDAFAAEGLSLRSAKFEATSVDFHIENKRHDRAAKAVGRAARILASGTPPSVETFRITMIENQLPTAEVEIKRSDMERFVDTHQATPESWDRVVIRNATETDNPTYEAPSMGLSYAVGPKVPFSLINGSIEYDVVLEVDATYQISPEFSLYAQLSQSLLGGLDQTVTTSGTLPAVRSNFSGYASDGPVLERLTADYVAKFGPSLYGRASAGYLERMFGGVSGELLWKDVNSPIAYGMEVNYAQQRDPGTMAGIGDYDVVSGHGSLYWDTGWSGVHAQIDAGKYLAGDWGATVTVSRRFRNGWEVAGYVTDTDADTSGSNSGKIDKGVRLTIPLAWSYPAPTRTKINVPFGDFSRDDGARLAIRNRLYGSVREVDRNRLRENWTGFWQ